jgi:hypothetical protein
VPTVVRKDIGRMTVPSRLETPKKPGRLEAKARSLKENISPPTGDPAPRRKILSVWQAWKGMRKTKTNGAPFYWVPRSLQSK